MSINNTQKMLTASWFVLWSVTLSCSNCKLCEIAFWIWPKFNRILLCSCDTCSSDCFYLNSWLHAVWVADTACSTGTWKERRVILLQLWSFLTSGIPVTYFRSFLLKWVSIFHFSYLPEEGLPDVFIPWGSNEFEINLVSLALC